MLPVILGAVALGTVGYGIKKCLEDEVECRCKITDWLIDGYDKCIRRSHSDTQPIYIRTLLINSGWIF